MKRTTVLFVMLASTLTACGHSHSRATPKDTGLAAVRYARCLRANGVPNFPDNGSAPPGGISIPDRAIKACAKYAPPGKVLDPGDPKTRDQFLKLARCMRAHGIPWADPSQNGLGGPAPDLSDVKDKAKVTAVLKICQQGPAWKNGS